MKIDRTTFFLLLTGIALRCAAINHPLLDSLLIRQCQTAAVTKSLIAEPGFQVSAKIGWMGDIDARYILELPIYNYLVIAVNYVSRDLDRSGKLTSILLWAASFLVLQLIWRRFLNQQEVFWANLLFVVAPLSVFYGQAFMPEMLVQLLAFTFLWLTLRYQENSTLDRWFLTASVGLLGLLVKMPEIAHLYLISGFLILMRESWKALLKPRYLLAAIVTIVVLKGWSSYVDSVNAIHLPEWTSATILRGFIGPLESRLHFMPWGMALLYVGAFILPGANLIAALYGFVVTIGRKHYRILMLWFVALGVFYVLWFGNGPSRQSYYNLPSLAPLSALGGIGIAALLKNRVLASRHALMSACIAVLVILPNIPVWQYLFTQDKQVLAATTWMKENTQPNDVVLFIPNHRWDMTDYAYNPVPSYYSDRKTFVLYKGLASETAERWSARAKFAIVTPPKSRDTGLLSIVNRFRNTSAHVPQATDWLERDGFASVAKTTEFVAFARQ